MRVGTDYDLHTFGSTGMIKFNAELNLKRLVNNLAIWHRACSLTKLSEPRHGEQRMDMSKGKHWRELCAEAAEEPDSEKVASLVNRILQAFEECDQRVMAPEHQAGDERKSPSRH
jgi:hypothetical protein